MASTFESLKQRACFVGFNLTSKTVAENGEFSVIINGGKYDIAYTAAVDETGRTLTINFDKDYPRKEIEKIDISYGSK